MKKLLPAVVMAVFLTALSGEIWQTAAGTQILTPFPMSNIRLQSGTPFNTCALTKIQGWLNAVNADNVLYIWRQSYGMATPGSAMGGWEAPSCNLRGHYTGHILSSLAMCYALTGSTGILNKAQYIIRSLDTCQGRATTMGWAAGCLSAYGQQQFTNLENGGTYPSGCWAPWYTQHKVLAGLVKCYQDMGDTLALHVAKDMASWAYTRLSALSTATLQSMWSRYIAGEYGGYNEAAEELYTITGRANDRALGLLFDDNTTTGASLTNLIANTDALAGLHANMYIPRIIGYLRDYDATSTASYYTAAYNFFDQVDLHHRFCNGGINYHSSNAEAFMVRDGESTAYTGTGSAVETCASYNMHKFGKVMYYHDALNSKYYDFADRASFNELLRISNPNSTSTTAWGRYGTPVYNNMTSAVDNSDVNGGNATCCGGTSMEIPLRMVEGIFAYRGDTLFINTFIGATLNWAAKGVTVAMNTLFPERDTVRLTITATGAVTMPIKIRAPWWKRRAWTISVDGVPVNALGTGSPDIRIPPSSICAIRTGAGGTPIWTTWTAGTHTVVITVPQSLRFEHGVGGAATWGGIFFGPVVLTSPANSGVITTTGTNTRASATSASWTINGVSMTPQYRVTANYDTYNDVSSIPATWTDTTWEVPVSVSNSRTGVTPVLAAPTVKMQKSQITVSFTSAISADQNLRVRIFNAQGALVADLMGTLQKGARSATLSQPKNVLAAGMYVVNVTAGERNYRTSLVCDR